MAKRPLRRYVRRAQNKARRYGRKRDKRMPLSVASGLAVSVTAPPAAGWGSVIEKVKAGKFDEAAQSFIASWTGLKIGGIGGQGVTEINLQGLINPMDFTVAPALKTTIITGIASKAIKRFLHIDPIQSIPMINKYLKFA